MIGILLRTAITMLGLFLASAIVSGIAINGFGSFAIAAILLGVANAVIRPIAVLLTLPITIITLGLFIFVINASMLGLVASALDGFSISGFWAAIFGSIVISITSTIASWTIGPGGRYRVYVTRRY